MEEIKKDYFDNADLEKKLGMSNRPYLKEVKPLGNYRLLLTYSNDEIKIFDAVPLFKYKHYEKLKNEDFFNSVRVEHHDLVWSDELDIDPIVLYESSEKVNQ